MTEITTTEERVEWLAKTYDLSENNAKALILAELGYSHSGIASTLGVTSGTAKKYLRRLESRIGEGVTEALPKSGRYPTFPGDDTSEDEYTGDYVEYEPRFSEGETSVNKGCSLDEIDPSLITVSR